MARGSVVRVLLVAAAACLLLVGPSHASTQHYFTGDWDPGSPCFVFSKISHTSSGTAAYDPNLSSFGNILNFLEYGEMFQTTWCGSGGGTRYTILAPSNAGLEAGLNTLHAHYGTLTNTSALSYYGPPERPTDKLSEVFAGIADFHFIPHPVDFYSDANVLKAKKEKPLELPVTYAYTNPNAHISVWTENGVVYVKPSGGGLLEQPAYPVQKTHTTLGPKQKGDDTLIYIHTIEGLLVPDRVPDLKDPQGSNGQVTKTVSLAYLLESVKGCTHAYYSGYPKNAPRAKGCSKSN